MHPPAQILESIAARFGTPCYVYTLSILEDRCQQLLAALPAAHVRFAVKANSTGEILRRVFAHGMGADVVSGGELARAQRAGVDASRIVFSGVGKQDWEIEAGLKASVSFNAESTEEIGRIHAWAEKLNTKAKLLLRVNPNIPAKTDPYISTGLYATKFGIAERDLETAVRLARSLPRLSLMGLSCHLGSQITDLSVFEQGAKRLSELAAPLRQGHPEFRQLNLGGGLAVRYNQETPPSIESYGKVLLSAAASVGMELIVEPGRWLVAECGGLLTRAITVKSTPEKTFVVVDAAMNDLLRPSLYKAHHPATPVTPREGAPVKVDIVGPVCETGDFLALDRTLPPILPSDLVWIGTCGAYGSTMASQYNSRARAAEVLLENETPRLIRKRESLDALWSQEV